MTQKLYQDIEFIIQVQIKSIMLRQNDIFPGNYSSQTDIISLTLKLRRQFVEQVKLHFFHIVA